MEPRDVGINGELHGCAVGFRFTKEFHSIRRCITNCSIPYARNNDRAPRILRRDFRFVSFEI